MRLTRWHAVAVIFTSSLLICCGAILMRSIALPAQEKAAAAKKPGLSGGGIANAYRLNTLGVAYMNQQRPADAQKYFEQALEAAPKFAVARLNLGISLRAQQKLEAARAALEAAAQQLPKDAYAWYNLGLVYKDLGETEKGIAAFQHVTEITQEADPYYFVGYLYKQLQKYDEAIAAFQKALALFRIMRRRSLGWRRRFSGRAMRHRRANTWRASRKSRPSISGHRSARATAIKAVSHSRSCR